MYDRGRGLESSPAYDVVFTHPYGDTETMALPIAGEARVARIDRRTFLDAGEQCGVRTAAMERVIDRLLDRTKDAPERLATGWPRDVERYRRVLEQRRRRLAR